jgi:small ligand-binding sensory domain FIST
MRSTHGVVGTYEGPWDELTIAAWAQSLRDQLAAPSVSLGVLFVSARFEAPLDSLLETLRLKARIPLLVGSTAAGCTSGGMEQPEASGFVLALYHLPGARLRAVHVRDEDLEQISEPTNCHRFTGIEPNASRGWMIFADPFQTDNEGWLRAWNGAYPRLPLVGGLATGASGERSCALFLDGNVHTAGTVAVSVGGGAAIFPVLSQGCSPIGDPWTITRAERNFILGIGNRPAYSVLVETYNSLSAEEQRLCHDNMMVGFACDEYRDEFQPGDFLVRQLIGADPRAGALAVGAKPRTGQTIQFQRRDPAGATHDLTRVLERTRGLIGSRRVFGGVLWTCAGRGSGFFGVPSHDAGLIQEHLGPLVVAGGTANGEIGPVGSRSFFHAYTASLGLLVSA